MGVDDFSTNRSITTSRPPSALSASGLDRLIRAYWNCAPGMIGSKDRLRRQFEMQGDSSLPAGEDVMATNAGRGRVETPGAARGRRRAGQRSILQLVLGGCAGTVALALIMFFLEPALISRSSDPAQALGAELSTPHGLGLIVFHFFNGSIVFPLCFAFFATPLRGPWLAKGLIWGTILWLLAGVVVMPISGFGLFGYNADGLRFATSSLVGHLAYGGLQGLIAGIPPRERD
jgi:hypothetical protein